MRAESDEEFMDPDGEREENDCKWRRWCRLCAKEDGTGNVSVFTKTESQSLDATLATAIGKYFWVTIRPEDSISKDLCVECHTLINVLVSFTERVNKVQAMYALLENAQLRNDLQLKNVRRQYELLDEDRDHIIRSYDQASASKTPAEEIDILSAEEQYIEEEVVIEGHVAAEELIEDEEGVPTDEDGEEEAPPCYQYLPSGEEAPPDGDEDDEERDVSQRDDVERDVSQRDDEERDVSQREDEEMLLQDDEDTVHFELTDDDASHLASVEGDITRLRRVLDQDKEEEDEIDIDVDEDEDHVREEEVEAEPPTPAPKRKRGRPPTRENAIIYNAMKRRRRRDEANGDGEGDGNADAATTTPDLYTCGVCGRKYKNPTSYRKHMIETHQTEPDIPDFLCDKCHRIFPTKKQLALHMRSHLPLELKLDIPCPLCDKKFTKITIMRQHVNSVHQNKKPFICDECGRSAKTLAALNEHKLVHTNECPFECGVCNRRFKNKARLKIHADIHTATNYVCSICGLQLNTRRTLKMHMLVHSEHKQYKCDFCESAFKRSKALKNHLILHTGLRPYKCNFCEKTFSNGSNCRSHKKKIHPELLEREEAAGLRSAPTSIPKIEELRSCSNMVENPRKVQRYSGGLPEHMRALLIAAEQRKYRFRKNSVGGAGASRRSSNPLCEDDDATEPSVLGADEDEEEVDVEEEVIYEIIDEI